MGSLSKFGIVVLVGGIAGVIGCSTPSSDRHEYEVESREEMSSVKNTHAKKVTNHTEVSKTRVVGYFPSWEPARGYRVKDMVENGAADKLTHILFAFGDVKDGKCTVVHEEDAIFDHHYSAEDSVDGIADMDDAPVKGVLGQFKRLKTLYPDIQLLWSIGGWLKSPGFIEAAKDVEKFADSCYDLIHDPRWDGVFAGIDIDWEYPNTCGVACDESGPDGYYKLMKAVRARFGDGLVTTAIGAQMKTLTAADYAKAEPYIDFYMPMTYDYAGAWLAQGPVAPHSPLYPVEGLNVTGASTHESIQYLIEEGIPANKILVGIGFYGRGWSGVSSSKVGSSAEQPAQGLHDNGADTYSALIKRCPATEIVAGTAYGYCNGEWWSYDTPQTIHGKMDYVKEHKLGGAFFWQLGGDTKDIELLNAIVDGLEKDNR